MKLVFLDAKTIGSDIDLSAFEDFGEVIYHDFTTPSEASARTQDADVLIVNKTPVNETTIGNASHLKLVCPDHPFPGKAEAGLRHRHGYQ